MKQVTNWIENQVVLNELIEFKRQIETQNYDLHGRRFTNVGGALDPNDFTTLHQLRGSHDAIRVEINDLIKRISILEKRLANQEAA